MTKPPSSQNDSLPRFGSVKSNAFAHGLQVFTYEHHEAPVVSIQAWVKTGSIHEAANLGCGLSHFLEHMMFHGSSRYSYEDIIDQVHQSGGEINAYTSFGCTVYHIDTPIAGLSKAVDILADVVTAPRFPEDDFTREKDIILRERAMSRDNPDRMLSEKLWLNMFQVHPVRHPIIGYHDQIVTVDRKMMMAYYQARYFPENTFLVISGDVTADEVMALGNHNWAQWQAPTVSAEPLPAETAQDVIREEEFEFPDPLARLAIGWHVPPACHPDVPALDLLAAILGQGKSSRLVHQLHDELELAINIDAFNYTPYFTGVFAISATTQANKMAALKNAILEEVNKIISGDIQEEEFQKVIAQAVTNYYRGLRTNRRIAQIIGNSILSTGKADYADQYLVDLQALSIAELQRCAREYLLLEQRTEITQLSPPEAAPAKQEEAE